MSPTYDLIALITAAIDSGDRRKIATAKRVARDAGYDDWHALVGKAVYGPGLGLTRAQILDRGQQ